MSYRPQPGPSYAPQQSPYSPNLGQQGGMLNPHSAQGGGGGGGGFPSNTLPSGGSSPGAIGRNASPLPQISALNLGAPGSVGAGQQGQQQHPGLSRGNSGEKESDYVYFDRRPQQYGEQVTGKATAAKMKLELFYKETVENVVARKERWVLA